MNKKNLSTIQFACLIGSPIVSLFSGIGTHNLIKTSNLDSWISVIISYFIGLIPLLIFIYIFNYKEELNITEKNTYLFGKTIGNFLNISINILFFSIGMVQLYNISNFAISQFLSETPIIFFMFLFGILIIYSVNTGLENISRIGIIFLTIITILTIISTLGLIPTIDISNLKPILKNGITSPLKGSLLLTTTNVTPIFLLLITAKKNIIEKEKINKYFFIFYTLAFLFIFIAIFLAISSLGIYLCQVYQYPEYTVLKKISLFNFIERIENFIYIKWILNSFLTLSLIVYHISNSSKKNSKLFPLIITLLLIIITNIVFKNNTFFYFLGEHLFPYISLFLLIIYIIIFIKIFIRKRLAKQD